MQEVSDDMKTMDGYRAAMIGREEGIRTSTNGVTPQDTGTDGEGWVNNDMERARSRYDSWHNVRSFHSVE